MGFETQGSRGSSSGSSAKVYKALITQSGTNAPTAVVLENTLGFSPVFSIQGAGSYAIDGDGVVTAPFPFGKTFFTITNKSNTKQFAVDRAGTQDDQLYVYSFSGTGSLQNGLLTTVPLLIEVYP